MVEERILQLFACSSGSDRSECGFRLIKRDAYNGWSTLGREANTVGYHNNENPNYHFGCPFIYEGALNFDGKVMQVDALIELTVSWHKSCGSHRFLA